ncbi:MAG: YMGG-like glycine zipper-containing protein [Bryobacter sp.]|nr:YMGG-like glycine zipper-containing protein [Bryobacter sp.]
MRNFILFLALASLSFSQEGTVRGGGSRRIPANTTISVSLIETIDSENAKVGDTFRASLQEPIVVNGITRAPKGSDATVRLIDMEKSGKFAGKTGLAVVLDSVTIRGQRVTLETGEVTKTSGSQAKNTALKTGIGAGIGAAIGAIAGGGKGAAIGAGVGGAAGAASQIFTGGKRVKLPSETVLTFVTSAAARY